MVSNNNQIEVRKVIFKDRYMCLGKIGRCSYIRETLTASVG